VRPPDRRLRGALPRALMSVNSDGNLVIARIWTVINRTVLFMGSTVGIMFIQRLILVETNTVN